MKKFLPIVSFLMPLAGLALLGIRRLRGRWRVAREVSALQGLRRPMGQTRRTSR